MCDKQNPFYFFGEKDEKDEYTVGQESFLENHSDKLLVKQSDYIYSNWVDIAEGTQIEEENKYINKAFMKIYKQESFKASNILIQATDKTTKKVKYFDQDSSNLYYI